MPLGHFLAAKKWGVNERQKKSVAWSGVSSKENEKKKKTRNWGQSTILCPKNLGLRYKKTPRKKNSNIFLREHGGL